MPFKEENHKKKNGKKRLAMISVHADPLAKLGGREMGGQTVYIIELSRQLAKMGWTVDIFTRLTRKRTRKMRRLSKNLNVIYLKAGPHSDIPKEKYFKDLPEFVGNFLIYKEKHKINYDIVHGHYYNGGWVACHIKRLFQIPMVQTFHTLGHVRHRALQKFAKEDVEMIAPLEERIMAEQESMNVADKIVASNPSEKRNILRYYNFNLEEKIATIPCGVNLQKFKKVNKERARKDRGFSSNEKVILYIGRLDRLKGIDVIIKALPSVIKEFKKTKNKIKFIIIGGKLGKRGDEGDNREAERLRKIVSDLGIEENVVFKGKRNHEKLKYYYSAADLFITAPYYETFGMTALETMRCGTPLIASNIGGLPTLIDDKKNGLLFPAGDYKSLSKKIIKILKEEKLQKTLIENGEKKVKENFGWKKVAHDMIDLYQFLI